MPPGDDDASLRMQFLIFLEAMPLASPLPEQCRRTLRVGEMYLLDADQTEAETKVLVKLWEASCSAGRIEAGAALVRCDGRHRRSEDGERERDPATHNRSRHCRGRGASRNRALRAAREPPRQHARQSSWQKRHRPARRSSGRVPLGLGHGALLRRRGSDSDPFCDWCDSLPN
jgi:hypothetical protein